MSSPSKTFFIALFIAIPPIFFQNCGSSDFLGVSQSLSSSAQTESPIFLNMGGEPYQGGDPLFPASARVGTCIGNDQSPIASVTIYSVDRYFLVYDFNNSLLSSPSPRRTLGYSSIDSVTVNGRVAENLIVVGFETSPTRDQFRVQLIFNGQPQSIVLNCSI